MSRVALAPSGGRAAGALLTVILRGSMLDRREDGSLCAARALARCDLQLARPVPGPGARRRRRGPKGLRAARGAQRMTVPGLTAAPRQAGTAPRLSQRNFACR